MTITLKPALTEGLGGSNKASLLGALQSAIELEHSTIPPYLYALYSIIPGRNDTVADILDSVVIEEMLHLALVANVINALGGSPILDTPGFIPTYPGPLPGAVDSGLIVGLAPCSVAVITDIFMEIERPEHPLDIDVLLAPTAEEPVTIGQFYRRIEATIVELGDAAFAPGPVNQIGPDLMDDSIVVTNVETACQAINTIVEQGEGTSTTPLEVIGTEPAHYYRFEQIEKGGLLVPNPKAGPNPKPDEAYVYDTVNHPVHLDPAGIFPVPVNPKVTNTTTPTYPPGSVGQVANDNFNYTYTSLLKVLHDSLNGQPELLNRAIGLMMSLRQQAMDMTSGTNTGNLNIGPSFEYQPVNPGLPNFTG